MHGCLKRVSFQTILRDEYVEADIDYEKVAKLASGFSGSDLKEVCRLAALTRLQEVDTPETEWYASHCSIPH